MALDDIKKSILDEAQTQVAAVEKEGESKLAELRAAWAKKIETRQIELVAAAKRKAEQKLQQAQFKLHAQTQNEVLTRKQKIIDKVYKQVVEQLRALEEDQYVDLTAKLIEELPDLDGILTSVKNKESLLKKAVKKSGRKFDIADETITGVGGFIFRSTKIEIDNTFEVLVGIGREQTILEGSRRLFVSPQE